MKKKMSFILAITMSFVLFSSQTVFANEINSEEVDDSFVIDIKNSFYEVVSEEEVILDFMKKEDVDRDTAIAELGITEMNTYASCSTQWRHYTSTKKLIEKKGLSGVKLTLSPYVKVKNCSGDETFVSVSSAQPGYAFSGLFSNSAHLTTAGAIKSSDQQLRLHASGYVKPMIGSKRYWNWDHCISAKVSKGVLGCF